MKSNFNKIPKNEKIDIICIVSAAVILMFLFLFVGRPVVVSGSSMEPTLNSSDVCIGLNYRGDTLKHGDIIVAKPKSIDEIIVKRVIAVGGDEVYIDYETNEVSINGEVLEEPYIADHDLAPNGDITFPVEVPAGYVFVMGDNRNASTDSRSSVVGLISLDDVEYRLAFRLFPNPGSLSED